MAVALSAMETPLRWGRCVHLAFKKTLLATWEFSHLPIHSATKWLIQSENHLIGPSPSIWQYPMEGEVAPEGPHQGYLDFADLTV